MPAGVDGGHMYLPCWKVSVQLLQASSVCSAQVEQRPVGLLPRALLYHTPMQRGWKVMCVAIVIQCVVLQ